MPGSPVSTTACPDVAALSISPEADGMRRPRVPPRPPRSGCSAFPFAHASVVVKRVGATAAVLHVVAAGAVRREPDLVEVLLRLRDLHQLLVGGYLALRRLLVRLPRLLRLLIGGGDTVLRLRVPG